MFRFTIRELVLLTLVVALGVAWSLDRRTVAGARDQAFLDCRTLATFTSPACGYPITDEVKAILLPIYNKYCAEQPEALFDPGGPPAPMIPDWREPLQTVSPLP